MSALQNMKIIKSRIRLLRYFNGHIDPKGFLSLSNSKSHTAFLAKSPSLSLGSINFASRHFSTGISLYKQETIKIEKDDYTVYMTNTKESSSSLKENTPSSSNDALASSNEEFIIPEPPPLPGSQEIPETLPNSIVESIPLEGGVEPTLASIGLGGWYPPGIAQQLLQSIHTSTGLPWCGTIALTTLFLRLLLFPAVIASQKNGIRLRNTMPKLTRLQQHLEEAQSAGDKVEAMRTTMKLAKFMKEENVNPKKQLIPTLVQAPVFISFFLGLRAMANVPVASFQQGGLAWFSDLTVADPYYILPLLTSLSLYANIKLGADFTHVTKHQYFLKRFMQGVPVVVFLLAMNMPAAVLCYWVSNNIITNGQILLLKLKPVRKFLHFPVAAKPPVSQPSQNDDKGMWAKGKEAYYNMKKNRAIGHLEPADDMEFKRAGVGPVPKTYDYDPTKVQPRRTYSTLIDPSDFPFRVQ